MLYGSKAPQRADDNEKSADNLEHRNVVDSAVNVFVYRSVWKVSKAYSSKNLSPF
jgi:hypothetical protein